MKAGEDGGIVLIDGVPCAPGEACIPISDPAFTVGWSVFEALRAEGGQIAELEAHLDRLGESCAAACLPPPDRALLAAELRIAAATVPGPSRLRVTLTGGGRRVVLAEPRDEARMHAPVRCARGPHVEDPFLPGFVKHGSRAGWVVAVRRAGVDDVLRVDGQGRFTEGTTCAILAVIGGTLWTAPHDGRILESTACRAVLRRAEALGVPVRREGPSAAGPWDGLYVASATRGLAPVVELDGEALPGWEPIGRRLAERD